MANHALAKVRPSKASPLKVPPGWVSPGHGKFPGRARVQKVMRQTSDSSLQMPHISPLKTPSANIKFERVGDQTAEKLIEPSDTPAQEKTNFGGELIHQSGPVGHPSKPIPKGTCGSNTPVKPTYSVTTVIKPPSTSLSSVTTIGSHKVNGVACKDPVAKVWNYRVTSMKGKGNMDIVPYPATHIPNPVKGGNIVKNPKAGVGGGHYCDVIADLADYTSSGGAGPRWHVTQSTKDHENYHWEKEWQPNFNKHWIDGEKKIEKLTESIATHPTGAAARTSMQPKADLIVAETRRKALVDYKALGDGANDPPYKEGQKALDVMIDKIKAFAKGQKWPICP